MLFSNIYTKNIFGNANGILQQGFGMFGCNSFDGQSFGALGPCGSIFTDCYGNIDFDKKAGYQVGNALLSVGMMAASSLIQPSEPKINIQDVCSDLNTKLENKKDTLEELEADKSELSSNLTTATKSKDELNSKLNSLASISVLEINLENAKENYQNNPNDNEARLQLEQAEKQLEETKKQKADLEAKIKTQDDIINDANEKLPTIQSEIVTLKDEIQLLQEQYDKNKAKLQNDENNDVLNKADGNWIERKLGGKTGDMRQQLRKYRKMKQKYDANPTPENAKKLYELGKNTINDYSDLKGEKEFKEAFSIIEETQSKIQKKHFSESDNS